MGADIRSLRTRLKSVDSTLHLTRAMGLVASSKMRRANEAMMKGRDYAAALSSLKETLVTYRECQASPFLKAHDEGDDTLVVIAGDRGLAGGYNANIFRTLRDCPNVKTIPIGKRACDRLGGELFLAETLRYEEARAIADRVIQDYLDGKIRRFGILSTVYHSMMSQEAVITWILPLTPKEAASPVSLLFEPDPMTVLNTMLPTYIAGLIVSAVRESFASEVAARRVAMDSAGKNAEEMIADLTLAYNRARQGAITQEITEIVAGSGL